MTLEWIERGLRMAGGLSGLIVLALMLSGLWRGLRRSAGRTTGTTTFLRSPLFYILFSLLYFGLCVLIWQPVDFQLNQSGRIVFLAAGSLLFFSGLGLVLWGRLTLGRLYFGSTTLGAQLFEDHTLIKSGPFAFIRHPMYLGMFLVGLGGILLFQTWTMVFFALHFPALVRRARREEQVLAEQFGEEWRLYTQNVRSWIPRLIQKRLHPGPAALLEIGILFLPAIPAYLWFWPNASGNLAEIGQIIAYVYFAAGALWIGRRWSLSSLGFNRRGIWLGLICGLVLIASRTLILAGVKTDLALPEVSAGKLIGQIAFYIGLVGFVEELLFRGLIYRALEDWVGTRWAIWVSTFCFGLWHVFGQGPVVGAATLLYGLIFGLMRLRAGGIIGLILAHGLMDLTTVLIISPGNLQALMDNRPEFDQPVLILVGWIGLIALPVYLWKIQPLWLKKSTRAASVD